MDQQQQLSGGGGGSDNINLNNISYGANSNENSQQADSDSNLLNSDKVLNNNENINPVGAMPIKMDINQLLSQIMSITSQSLKDAQER